MKPKKIIPTDMNEVIEEFKKKGKKPQLIIIGHYK